MTNSNKAPARGKNHFSHVEKKAVDKLLVDVRVRTILYTKFIWNILLDSGGMWLLCIHALLLFHSEAL